MTLTAGLVLSLAVAVPAPEPCGSGPAVRLAAGENRAGLEDRLAVLVETQGRLTLDDVEGPKGCSLFTRPRDRSRLVVRGVPRFWLRFRVGLGGELPRDWLLFLPISNFERVCVHWPSTRGGNVMRCAGAIPLAPERTAIRHNRLVFTLPDDLDPERPVFLEVESKAPQTIRGELVRAHVFLSEDHRVQFLGGVFNGLLLATVLYNLIFFVGARDRASLFYAVHLLSLGLAMVGFEGRGREFLWPWLGRWGVSVPTALVGTSLLFGCLYAREFLTTRRRAPQLDRMLRLAMVPAAVVLPLSLVDVDRAEQTAAFAALCFVTSLVSAATVLAHRGDRPALYFLFGLSAFLVGMISVSLRVLGASVIPDAWGFPLTRAGLVVASVAISAGLGLRVVDLRHERDRAERAEATAAEEWRATFDAVDVLVVLVDDTGRVTRLNRAAAAQCGRDFAGALGRPLRELGEGEPWAAAARLVPRVVLSRSRAEEIVRDGATGKTWGLSTIRFSIPATAGERTVVLARDLTAVAQLEESLRRREHMAAMGSLVAGVAHEVRNPLFGISSTVDTLEARAGRAEMLPRHLETLRSQVDRLGKLMNDLLEYGRSPDLERKAEDLMSVIEEAGRACDFLARRDGATIETLAPDDLPAVLVDRKRVVQVFQNLLDNALRHSPPGGRVVVDVRRDGLPDGHRVRASVRDTGPGFATADLPHVFEPFFTRRRGGTGLGLSIVQRIVEQHGGRVEARNDPAGGAEVVVCLPTGGPGAGST